MAEEKSKAVNRPKRTSLGAKNRLSFGKQDPGFVYRVINDKDDRLKDAQAAGYDFVHGDEKLGDERVGEGGAIDTRISKPVGNGVRGYLMRIPKEFYDEDQAAKMSAVEETEKAMDPKERKKIEGAEAYGDFTKT